MNYLPYQGNPELFPHLTSWFRYRQLSYDGFARLRQIRNEPGTFKNVVISSEKDFSPLTEAEEHRWGVLERKARQENLSGNDSAEYDILLQIKLYQRYKADNPELSHDYLVAFIKELV